MDVAHFKTVLLARRADLQRDVETGEQGTETVKLDQSCVGRLSRMDAMQGQAMSQESQRRREQALQRISAALRRIDEGDYGNCVDCGELIADARLAIDPSTLLCIVCAGKQDQAVIV